MMDMEQPKSVRPRMLRRGLRFMGMVMLVLVLTQLSLANNAQAQSRLTGQKPIMENVFFNVVWGSVLGMMLGGAAATIEAEVKTQPYQLSDRVALGATWGGLAGLGVGIWLANNGISFDPSAALFNFGPPAPPSMPLGSIGPPLEFETAPGNPLRITGLSARLVSWRF